MDAYIIRMAATEKPLCNICQPPRRHGRSERHKFEGKATDLNEASLTAALVKVKQLTRDVGGKIGTTPTKVIVTDPRDLALAQVLARRNYHKLKARERRKRERAAADRLGMTVAEYRFRKSKGEL